MNARYLKAKCYRLRKELDKTIELYLNQLRAKKPNPTTDDILNETSFEFDMLPEDLRRTFIK